MSTKRKAKAQQTVQKVEKLSNLWIETHKPIACFVSDLHLDDAVPRAIASRDDWIEMQFNLLAELKATAFKLNCPIYVAGDFFNKHSQPPRHLNALIMQLRELNRREPDCEATRMYTIFGQHDLPFHDYKERAQSAIYNLELNGVVKYLKNECHLYHPADAGTSIGIVSPFHWGEELYKNNYTDHPNIALIHRYVWIEGCGHPGAKKDDHADTIIKQLQGYEWIICGDNHTPFVHKNLINCGTAMPRRWDERHNRPMMYILGIDFNMHKYSLKYKRPPLLDPHENRIEQGSDFSDFIKNTETLIDSNIDFLEELRMQLRNGPLTKEAKRIITSVMDALRCRQN